MIGSLVTVDLGDLSDRALSILLLTELKGLRMDITELKTQLQTLTGQLTETGTALAATKASLDTSNTVIGKVVDEETGLLVRIQTLLDTLNNAATLPPDVAAAMADASNAMAAVKTAAAAVDLSATAVATTAGAADALVPDGSAG